MSRPSSPCPVLLDDLWVTPPAAGKDAQPVVLQDRAAALEAAALLPLPWRQPFLDIF